MPTVRRRGGGYDQASTEAAPGTMTGTADLTSFDHELEAERIRWLRRRFLWLCWTSVALIVLVNLQGLPLLGSPDARTRAAEQLDLAAAIARMVMYAAAGWYASKTIPR